MAVSINISAICGKEFFFLLEPLHTFFFPFSSLVGREIASKQSMSVRVGWYLSNGIICERRNGSQILNSRFDYHEDLVVFTHVHTE